MAIIKTEAIVLRKRDLRETSLLVNFFTKDFGKITGQMKGIRNDPKKFASNVELFSNNEINFYHSRHSSVHLVSQCDIRDNFINIRQNMSRIVDASLVVELLDVVMPAEDKNTEIFSLTLETLNELSTSQNPDKILTIFKIKTLTLSGFKPHLDSCVCCGSKDFNQIKFSLRLGGLLCSRCINKDNQARQIFKGTIATIMHIEKNGLEANLKLGMNPAIKKELDIMLNAFLNFHLGKELKSQRSINKLNTAGAL
jgi:DNA repair protein RecO (recombination protein O)